MKMREPTWQGGEWQGDLYTEGSEWWFRDEAEGVIGPYETRAKAKEASARYALALNHGNT